MSVYVISSSNGEFYHNFVAFTLSPFETPSGRGKLLSIVNFDNEETNYVTQESETQATFDEVIYNLSKNKISLVHYKSLCVGKTMFVPERISKLIKKNKISSFY